MTRGSAVASVLPCPTYVRAYLLCLLWYVQLYCMQVVPLKPGGASIEVTNENKMEYLNCLAQYRLVYRVKDEIEAFLKGS